MIARIPLVLQPQPEGGYSVTYPLLPEPITEGDTIPDAWPTRRMPLRRWWKSTKTRGGRDLKIGTLCSAIRNVVGSIQPGDRIAIKSTYRRKNGFPFDNQADQGYRGGAVLATTLVAELPELGNVNVQEIAA